MFGASAESLQGRQGVVFRRSGLGVVAVGVLRLRSAAPHCAQDDTVDKGTKVAGLLTAGPSTRTEVLGRDDTS